MVERFVKGEAYWAFPAVQGQERRRLVCCVGVEQGVARFAEIADTYAGRVEVLGFMGANRHEHCQFEGGDDVYHVSASAPVAFMDAAKMIEVMRRQRK